MSTANNVETLPDPPMVDFGQCLWKYRQAQDGHILVETEAVEKLIRERLTDEVLLEIDAALAGKPQEEIYEIVRDRIVKAIVGGEG